MRIGIFDSGVGGITVLSEALRMLPKEDFLYYADTDNVPYGTKSKEKVKSYINDAVSFIAKQNVKALVIACNTATSVAIESLRKQYSFPILGMEPAVKPAVENSAGKRVLVTATPLTLKEEKFQNLVARVDSYGIVDALPLPGLVEYAENFVFDESIIKEYLRNELVELDIKQYGTVVLGCTHFPFYRNVFKRLFPSNTDIIDGSSGTIRHLRHVLEERNLLGTNGSGNTVYYSSGRLQPVHSKYESYLKLYISGGR